MSGREREREKEKATLTVKGMGSLRQYTDRTIPCCWPSGKGKQDGGRMLGVRELTSARGILHSLREVGENTCEKGGDSKAVRTAEIGRCYVLVHSLADSSPQQLDPLCWARGEAAGHRGSMREEGARLMARPKEKGRG